MFALLGKSGITAREDRLTLVGRILHRPVETTNDLSEIEIHAVVDILDYWNRIDELPTRCAATVAEEQRVTASAQDVGDRQNPIEPQSDDTVPDIPLRDARGNQLIQVQFEHAGQAFTYVWGGDGDLSVGDKVRIPPARWSTMINDPGTVAAVCFLGSHYDGTITVLTKKAEE